MSDLEQMRHEVRQRLIEENEFPHIPANWGVERLRFLFTESKERNGKSPVGDMLSVSEYRGVVPREYENEEQKRTDDELENYRVVRQGQLAVNSMWLNHLGLGVSEHTGHVSPAYNVYDISDRLDRRFVHHLMRSNYYLKIYLRYLYGIRPNSFQIKSNDWASIPIIVPDLATQRAIADFLDRETARIDLLIEKKQRLVALLGEREENYIKGVLSGENIACLDKKTTEAPWLKSVPSRWDVVPLRHLVKIQTGNRDTQDREDDGEYPFFVRSMTVERINSYSFDKEAVLTSGDGAGVGIVFHHINCKFDLHQRMYAFTDFNRVSGRYFYFFLRTFFKLQMTQWSAKSTVDSVRMPFLKTLLVTVPPKEEQQRLVEDIENRAERDALVKERTIVSIARLKEYRSSLITAAVTGQIDVSTYAKSGATDRFLDKVEK